MIYLTMAKTARDAWKHIREWSEFFSDLRLTTNEEVEAFLARHAKRKYMEQSLQRLCERGLLDRTSGRFKPTKQGNAFFKRQALLKQMTKSKSYDLSHWDGKWRLISFDVPISFNKKRALLRRLLQEFNFYKLHRSVWVYPSHVGKVFWEMLVEHELDKFCQVMLVEFIEGDQEIKEHFFGGNRRVKN